MEVLSLDPTTTHASKEGCGHGVHDRESQGYEDLRTGIGKAMKS